MRSPWPRNGCRSGNLSRWAQLPWQLVEETPVSFHSRASTSWWRPTGWGVQPVRRHQDAGRVPFADFLGLALPSLVNWLIPALFLSVAIRGHPIQSDTQKPDLEPGAIAVLGLFLLTILMTVVLHTFLALPPAIRMMAGLGLLKGYSYFFNY